MDRVWRYFLLGLLALCLAACGPKVKLQPLPAGSVVLAFGDSLTYGTGAQEGEAYPARLASKTGWKVINAGVPGETAAQGRARFGATLDEVHPQLVLLCLGGNDFLQRLDPKVTQNELAAMLALLKQRQIPVLLIGVPKLGLGLATDPLYAELAEQYQVPLNDEALAEILGKKSLKSDTVHPNALGYQQLADQLLSQLSQLGAWRLP